jgi:hypothetical protein
MHVRPRPALLQLSRLVLKGMRQRGRGAVVNIGSGVATVIPSSPLLSGAALGPLWSVLCHAAAAQPLV